MALKKHQYIEIEKNDLIGLYFPKKNPIAYSVVPCSSLEQQYLYLENPSIDIEVDRTYTFRKPQNPSEGCRHYSFSAILGRWNLIRCLHLNTQRWDDFANLLISEQLRLIVVHLLSEHFKPQVIAAIVS